MKKKNAFFSNVILFILILFNINNVSALEQKTTTQYSNNVVENQVISSALWNSVVLDIANIISDIGSLKQYADEQMIKYFTDRTTYYEYNDSDVRIGKSLEVGGNIRTNSLIVPEGKIPLSIINSSNIKNGSIQQTKLDPNIDFGRSATFRKNGNVAYYTDGNVSIGGTNASEKLNIIDGNIIINGNGNGLIYPDGSKQTTAAIVSSNDVKLNGDQSIDGLKSFLDSLKLANGVEASVISNDNTFNTGDKNTIVTGKAIKEYIDSNFITDDGHCGSATYKFFTTPPTDNDGLCLIGESENITDNGDDTYSWQCSGINGGIVMSCDSSEAPIAGSCGPDDSGTFKTAPINLCSVGNASNITTDENTYRWSCQGLNNGDDANCIALKDNSLYDFTSHTFTNCGQTGRTGPSLSQCRSAYIVSWDNNTDFYNNSNGIQIWTVPEDGQYKITAYGSQGGDGDGPGGKGAVIRGNFNLNKGEKLKILVGQKGTDYYERGTGGGGTFVTKSNNSILVIAGGGGGGNDTAGSYEYGMDASTSTTGTNSARNYGRGGVSGNGGTYTGAGGGFNTNGDGGSCGGYSFINGGYGGSGYIDGGFGGGGVDEQCNSSTSDGEGGGGGGGYSGGGAGYGSYDDGGGGGGSYNSGTSQSNSIGGIGNGKVIIQKL